MSFVICIQGTIEAAQTLHDHTIEETETTANDKTDTENDVDQPNPIPIDAPTDRFSQFRKNSMAIYYAWQFICLLVFIFTVYETLQTV